MLTPRMFRRLVALACVVLLVAIAAHATLDVIQLARDHSVDSAVVVCLLVFTIVYAAVRPRARGSSVFLFAVAPDIAPKSRLAVATNDRARASPVWIQRFLR